MFDVDDFFGSGNARNNSDGPFPLDRGFRPGRRRSGGSHRHLLSPPQQQQQPQPPQQQRLLSPPKLPLEKKLSENWRAVTMHGNLEILRSHSTVKTNWRREMDAAVVTGDEERVREMLADGRIREEVPRAKWSAEAEEAPVHR